MATLTDALLSFTPQLTSAAFDRLPNNYSMLGDMKLFTDKALLNKFAILEQRNGLLSLLPSKSSSSPASIADKVERVRHVLETIRIPHSDFIAPDDIAGLTNFAGTAQETMGQFVAERLQTLKNHHDLTHEWLMIGAINGKIIDGDGSTVLHDLYNTFGVTEKVVTLNLASTTSDVPSLMREIARWIKKHTFGDRVSGVILLVNGVLFDKIITHKSVKDIYLNYQKSAEVLGKTIESTLELGGITIKEYDATVTDANSTVRDFFLDTEGRAFPVGTRNTFKMFSSPANFNETVNRLGQRYVAKIEPADFNMGYNIYTESNVLPVCMNPESLVRVVA